MRLPGRLTAAIEVLADIEARKRPAADALRDWGLSHRFAGSGDRAAIGNLVYDALRKRASHAFIMGEDTPRALVLSVVASDWGEDIAALSAEFATDRFAPAALSDAELQALQSPERLDGAPDHVRAEIPEWLAASFATAFGPQWIAEGQGLAQRPPLDMRVNTIKSDIARVLKSLRRFDAEPGGLAPNAVRIAAGTRDARTPNVQTDEGYIKGWFEIQDQGSQIVSALVDAEPGQQVLDICAGGGGKTLAMSAAMTNKGQVFAYDADRARLAPIHDRLKRAGVRNVQVVNPDPGALDDLERRMDRVLVDAPCTGTGTWRRRPDAKWRLSQAQLQARVVEQTEVLENAARFVRPGGELVYVTCSLLPEENGNRIANFVAQHPDFSPVRVADRWAACLGADAPAPTWSDETSVTLTPATTATDGFYCAVLRRDA